MRWLGTQSLFRRFSSVGASRATIFPIRSMMKIPFRLSLYCLSIFAFWPGLIFAQSRPTPANPATIKAAVAKHAASFTKLSASSPVVSKNLDYLSEALARSVMKGTGKLPSDALRAESRELIFAMMEGIFNVERILESGEEYANFAASRLSETEAQLLLKVAEGNARLVMKYFEKREIVTLSFLGLSGDGFNAYFRSAMINSMRWQRGEYEFERSQLFPYRDSVEKRLYELMDAEERKVHELGNDELTVLSKDLVSWTKYKKSLPSDEEPFAIVRGSLDKIFQALVKRYASRPTDGVGTSIK